jgi:Flp pilus assembly protein TadG
MTKRLSNQRGNILLLTTILVIPVMLIFAGLATDIAYHGEVDAELQHAMDAAALAGAGQLAFSVDQFDDARAAAQQYAFANTYKTGTISLDPNVGNNETGDIVLGIWDPVARTFSPSTNGNLVDAVQTRFATTIPTSFLRVIGLTSLNAGATAIAWAPPPSLPGTCSFPISLTDGAFGCDGSEIPAGACGCGKPIRFISSSDESAIGMNTAGWANLEGCGTPNADATRDAVDAAADPNCPGSALKKGDYLGTQGGLVNTAFARIVFHFPTKFNESGDVEVFENDSQGNPTRTYNGQGWSVVVPVVSTTGTGSCPSGSTALFNGTMLTWIRQGGLRCLLPSVTRAFAAPDGGGNVNQNREITGWTTFLITQVIDQGKCLVNNPDDTGNSPLWPPQGSNAVPCGSRPSQPGDSALREVYGYYNCLKFDTPGDAAGPAGARGKPKLVR